MNVHGPYIALKDMIQTQQYGSEHFFATGNQLQLC